MMECFDNDEVSFRLHQALTEAGFANRSDEMEMEHDPLLHTLEELTLASPEEMQACEDTIMADMDQWVPIDESQVGDEDKDLKDVDDIPAEEYEQLRAKYLDPDYQPTDTPCACIKCIKLYEWEGPANPDESFAPVLYEPTSSTFQPNPEAIIGTWAKLLDKTSAPTPPPVPTKRAPINPFTPEVWKASLLHCPHTAPSTSTLLFYIQEYVRSLRLTKLRRRWSHLPISDFTTELSTLLHSLSNASNNLAPWPPLSAWLARYYAGMQGVPRNRRFKVKIGLLKELGEVAVAKVRENKAAVEELVEVRGERVGVGVWGVVRRAVDEECEVRGSLGLGFLPEFTDRVVGGMFGGWSWVD